MEKDGKTENTALIEQMVKEAEKVGEPGELTQGDIVHAGDDDVPSPMIMSEVTSAGHCLIYNTLTGAESVMNLNMLRRKLQLKRADGTPVFTTAKPDILPKLGKMSKPMIEILEKTTKACKPLLDLD